MVFSYAKINGNRIKESAQVLISEVSKAFKFSYIIGSKAAFFSLSQAIAPVIGFYASSSSVFIVYALRTLVHFFVLGLSAASFFYHVPTLFAALYISQESRITKALIPVVCILLFLAHPVGLQTAWYTLYWVLPLIVAFINTKSIFMRALASTLVSHAVGTLIWLYAGLLSAESIVAVATIAWLERLVFALALTAAYYGINYCLSLLEKVRTTAHAMTEQA